MNLTEWAHAQGIHVTSAYRWWREGTLPVPARKAGRLILVSPATGAVRYDIHLDPARGRWYLDASWRAPARPVPGISELRQAPVVAVDVNAGHLAAWTVTPDGNPAGPP